MKTLTPYLVFILPMLVGGITQVIKFIFYTFRHGWDFHYIMTHGHMPSAHTAFIVSVVTSVGYYDGIHSGAFAVALALALIVIDDAARLRMYMGDQGRYLNMLIRQLNINEEQFPRLKERVGHRISEVIVGGFLGFFLTLLLATLLR
ncbi:divergent PAP2 family protein [Patescibacteria group bacterium]|nr:MAG: divergent PAP2 family protein [Patescibacteria group bacterium]